MNWFAKLKAWREKRSIRNIIREAKRMHGVTGKQYHVVPIDNGKLKVVDNDFLKLYNGIVKGKRITGIELRKMAIYSTSTSGLESKIKKILK